MSGRSLWSVATPRFLPPARGSVRPFDSLVNSLVLMRATMRGGDTGQHAFGPLAMPYIRDRWPTFLRGSLVLLWAPPRPGPRECVGAKLNIPYNLVCVERAGE